MRRSIWKSLILITELYQTILDYSTDDLKIDVTETTLAYQLGAGLAIPVSDGVMIDARYRYFATTDFDVVGVVETNVSSHSALLGLRVNL